MVDLSMLEGHAAQASGWQPLSLVRLAGPDMIVLCVDQSLTSSGYVAIERSGGVLTVVRALTMKGESKAVGFEQDYAKALQIEDQVREQIRTDLPPAAVDRLVRIVHEAPPVINRRLMAKMPGAGMSSRMAGQAVRSAVHSLGGDEMVRMVNAQQAKTLVCGNAKADKSEAHAVLKRDVLPWIHGAQQVSNEHLRDALMLGLVVLWTVV